jgi:hypothetical protein
MVKITLAGFEKALAHVKDAPKQIRFAAVKALNETATSTQAAIVERLLPEKFTLRAKGRPWQQPGGPYGFNIRPFAKTSSPDPFAVLGSRADWLRLQETGGTKTSGTGKSLALPQLGGARPTLGAVISRRQKPARLLQRKGFFVAKGAHGHVILQRLGGKKNPRVKLWYGFAQSARIKPILGFREFAEAHVNKTLPDAFRRQLHAALASAH